MNESRACHANWPINACVASSSIKAAPSNIKLFSIARVNIDFVTSKVTKAFYSNFAFQHESGLKNEPSKTTIYSSSSE